MVVEIESVESRVRTREARVLCGAPEGERGDWMIEKLAELGVALLQPVDFDRAQWHRAQARIPRWQRIARAALRQSRGLFELEVRAPVSLAEALEHPGEPIEPWIADRSGARASRQAAAAAGSSVGLIGPAPGLTWEELDLAQARGFKPIALSNNNLRTETAALAWAAWWAGSGPEDETGPKP